MGIYHEISKIRSQRINEVAFRVRYVHISLETDFGAFVDLKTVYFKGCDRCTCLSFLFIVSLMSTITPMFILRQSNIV